MRGTLAVAFAILISAAAAMRASTAGQRPGKSDNPIPTQRFLLLGTNRISTIKKELDIAAQAGYRVLAGVGRTHLVLEKAARPPDTFQYLYAADREEVNEAAGKGFRMVPLVRAECGDKADYFRQVFLMEKTPGPTAAWTYSSEALSRDSRIIRLTIAISLFCSYCESRDPFFIYETPGKVMPTLRQAEQPDASTPPPSPALAAQGYLLLKADNLSELNPLIRDAAVLSYRVTAASDGQIALLAQRYPEAPPCEYRILAGMRSSTMQRKLNEAGREGFRLLPAGIGTYPKVVLGSLAGLASETYVVMQKCPDAGSCFEYRLVNSQAKLNESAEQRYEVVGMKEFMTHSGIVFMERPLPK
jgi:hypothetical protein